MFETIIDIVANPFKRLKVFYQILVIVGIMVVFFAIQGLLGIHFIGTVNANTKEIFSKSTDLLAVARELQETFVQLQMSYLNDVAKSENNIQLFFASNIEVDIASKIKLINLQDPEAASDMGEIEAKVKKIKKVMARPITTENYKQLESILFDTKLALNNYSNKVQTATYNAMSEGNKFSSLATVITIILLIVSSILASVLGFVVAILIDRPLKSVNATANALANGDLSRIITAKGSVEVTDVIESLNKAIISLRKLVKGIDEQSNVLYETSQELKSVSNETGRSAWEVANTMEELSRVSSDRAAHTGQAVEDMNSLAQLVRQVSQDMKNLSVNSENVAKSAQMGQKATTDVSNEMVKVYNTTKEVTKVINELNDTSVEIDAITTVIEGIAEQTTLLALNAQIEAARAGEHGKGFSVVADETGKLADQCKQAAQGISGLITQMKKRSEHAAKAITNGMHTVENGKQLALEATFTFGNIFDNLRNILIQIESVAYSARKMAERNESVITIFGDIAALSEESMASTEEVSAVAEEQSASVHQVATMAENLNSIAIKLKDSVAVFDIKSTL
ncbi:MAG TPA: methyl-accepting chemotaxis protein [Bacillota bacterium]|nr:methyl-accepting chemotaxis protein [Bacillota bacterium]